MTELRPTYGNFSIKGVVVGLFNDRYHTEGDKEGGSKWHRLSFGVKVSSTSFVYVELMGSKTSKVKLIYQNPINKKYEKDNSKLVSWGEQSKLPPNYRIHMPVKTCFNQSESLEFTSYEAIDNIKDNLNDGDSVYINGSLQYQEYQDKIQEKFVIQEIGLLDDRLNINELMNQEAYFTQEIVFLSIEKLRINKQYLIHSLIISKRDDELKKIPYTYVINYEKYASDDEEAQVKEVIRWFKEEITYGSTVRIFGNINHHLPTIEIDGQLVVAGSSVKEFEITGGSLKSVVRNRYSEEDLNSEPEKDPFVYEESLEVFEKAEHDWAF